MATFTPTQALLDARLVGGIDSILDIDDDPAYAILYNVSNAALVTILFDQPAAELVDHELVFQQGDLAGDQIMTQGHATSFKLFNGAGTLLGEGDVSDMEGDGTLKIEGTPGTLLYAGARAILGELKFT